MDDMYHVCRYCKHYKDGNCTKENFYIFDEESECYMGNTVELYVKEPDDFYCKHWE